MNLYDIAVIALLVYLGCVGLMVLTIALYRRQTRAIREAGQDLHDLATLACTRHSAATTLGHKEEWARVARTMQDLKKAVTAWEEANGGRAD